MQAAAIVLPFALVAPLLAQATFVVDAAGGAGANFTSIQAAVLAVPDGSIVVVRAGTYAAVDIFNKGLTILCDPGVVAVSTPGVPYLWIRGTAANQTVVVRGLLTSLPDWSVSVTATAGPVVLDRLGFVPRLDVVLASQLLVIDTLFTQSLPFSPPVSLHDAHAIFERCQMLGANGFGSFQAQSGLLLRSVLGACDVQLARCTVTGGNGHVYSGSGGAQIFSGAPAVSCDPGCTLRILDDGSHAVRSGTTPAPGVSPAPIVGGGPVRVVPAAVLVPPMVPSLTFTVVEMPSLTCTDAPVGGTVQIERRGQSGHLFSLAVDLPGPKSVWPGVPDPLWLDPSTLVVAAFGIAPATPWNFTKPVPLVAALRGFSMVWQSADVDLTGQLALSNAGFSVIH